MRCSAVVSTEERKRIWILNDNDESVEANILFVDSSMNVVRAYRPEAERLRDGVYVIDIDASGIPGYSVGVVAVGTAKGSFVVRHGDPVYAVFYQDDLFRSGLDITGTQIMYDGTKVAFGGFVDLGNGVYASASLMEEVSLVCVQKLCKVFDPYMVGGGNVSQEDCSDYEEKLQEYRSKLEELRMRIIELEKNGCIVGDSVSISGGSPSSYLEGDVDSRMESFIDSSKLKGSTGSRSVTNIDSTIVGNVDSKLKK